MGATIPSKKPLLYIWFSPQATVAKIGFLLLSNPAPEHAGRTQTIDLPILFFLQPFSSHERADPSSRLILSNDHNRPPFFLFIDFPLPTMGNPFLS
jgi:hypothetical protein